MSRYICISEFITEQHYLHSTCPFLCILCQYEYLRLSLTPTFTSFLSLYLHVPRPFSHYSPPHFMSLCGPSFNKLAVSSFTSSLQLLSFQTASFPMLYSFAYPCSSESTLLLCLQHFAEYLHSLLQYSNTQDPSVCFSYNHLFYTSFHKRVL